MNLEGSQNVDIDMLTDCLKSFKMEAENDTPDALVLSSKYSVIPLEALNASCRRHIALHMNLEGTLNEDIDMVTDYRGLAELVGFNYLEIKNFERERSPTEQLLADWTLRADLSPTVGELWKHLRTLERIDVLTDSKKLIGIVNKILFQIYIFYRGNPGPCVYTISKKTNAV